MVAPPATAPAGDVLALINGSILTRERFVDLLIECQGGRLLNEVILLTAAQQRGAAMGLSVSPADIQAAERDALQRLAVSLEGEASAAPNLDAARRLLADFLLAKNISPREWQLRMEQRAWLHRIAAAEVARMEITETMLRQQHERLHGEKVQIRHIQLSSLAAVARARALLAEKKDFEQVARRMSENPLTAASGGLMPPFTRNDPAVPPLIRETAFSLSVGQVSGAIHEQNAYHLIRIERRIPPSLVSFELADKNALRASLTDDLIRLRQDSLEGELFRAAVVDIRDPRLRAAFERQRGGPAAP